MLPFQLVLGWEHTEGGEMMERISAEDIARAVAIPGFLCIVDEMPDCEFCWIENGHISEGNYDFLVRGGGWAKGCEQHWLMYRAYPELGVGKGQYWLARKED